MTHRGIEANPEEIRAIREMSPPITKKEVQNLTGLLAALNRFISHSSDRFKPFFDVLKNAANFVWTNECEKAFDEIKQYLSTPPVLVSPKTGQPIGVYLAAAEYAVSAVLFVTDPHEKPVYFVSKFLTRAETRNKKIEKITLALFHASRRLKPYFQGRTAEKGHALAALLAYFPVDDIETVAGEEEELFKPIESATNQTGGESAMEVDTPEPLWTVFTDGSSNVGGYGVVYVILTPEGSRIEKATILGFQASNNEAEYEAAIIGLKAVKQLDAKNVKLLSSISDSHLVLALEHASGGERPTTSAQGDIENIDINMDIDSPMIDDSGNLAENVSDWRQPYIRYLTTSELPEDEKLDSKVKKNAWRYSMIEGKLYRKPVALEPFLRCISAEEGQQILAEAHEEICGNHSGGRSLSHRILTQGYFWPYMQKDAKEYAQKCIKVISSSDHSSSSSEEDSKTSKPKMKISVAEARAKTDRSLKDANNIINSMSLDHMRTVHDGFLKREAEDEKLATYRQKRRRLQQTRLAAEDEIRSHAHGVASNSDAEEVEFVW
ncbi:uncharacterized protein LOC113296337 [Papaver somniferum]|uniref:uncharacterized protein LOC113296337 n=1 Tax=Papaver somniferum TaxID=3469 RepID=UPI000E6F92BB|nr:uncharacterized protein LOC113296337 [Papaver somniferum]